MKHLNGFWFAGLSLWALGCSGTVSNSIDDAEVDGAADVATDRPPPQDAGPLVDIAVAEVGCTSVVQLEGFGELRPEHCAASNANRIADAGSAARRPPDASAEDVSTGLVPVRPDSGFVVDRPAPDATAPDDTGVPEMCNVDCALACRDVVVSANGSYARFWTGGTCARLGGGRVRCVMNVSCP